MSVPDSHPDSEMSRAHAEDYRRKNMYDAARHALEDLKLDEKAWARLHPFDQTSVGGVIKALKIESDRIVQVWD